MSRGEKIGDFADGVVERRIVIGHERSPSRDHPQRSPLSGRGAVWGASVNHIRGALEKCPARIRQFLSRVNQQQGRNWRRGETAFGKRWRRGWLAVQEGRGRNGETGNARNVGQLRTSHAAMASTNCGKDVGGKEFGSPDTYRAEDLLVDSQVFQTLCLRVFSDLPGLILFRQ